MDYTNCEKGAYCQDHTANQENLMDTNNWRSTPPSGEPTMDTGDWRTQLQPDSRQRIVNKIMDTLKRHLPFSGSEGLNELRKIAVRFEEKIFTAASSQSDYLRKISLKMLTMEMKSQNTVPSTGNNSKPADPGPRGMQNQVLQENLPTGQLPGYSDEHSKPSAQFLTSSPLLFRAPFVPSTSTLLTPSPTPGYSEKPIYGPSSLTNYRNICHQQATGEQARSECPVPDTPGNGMSTPLLLAGFENGNDTHGNALLADFGKSNVEEQRHDPRVIMAKPMSLKSLSASVVTMVDEAGAAVGEDLAAMRKRGLHARNFFAQTGMTGADKMRCYMSAIVILVLLFWCIFILHQQN